MSDDEFRQFSVIVW